MSGLPREGHISQAYQERGQYFRPTRDWAYISGLPRTGYNFQAYQELGLLLVLVAVAILTYASLVYFAEKESNEG